MLQPTKHMDLNHSLIRIAAILIKIIKQNQIIKFDMLMDRLIKNEGEMARFQLLPALNFIFLFGLIKYHSKTDSIEFVGNIN